MKRVPKWQKLVERLDALTESNGVAAWETAKIMSELLPMRSFHKSLGGKKEVEEKLQLYSGRFCLGLSDMTEMFKRFPDVESWREGRLDILRDETCRQLASEIRQKQLAENGERDETKNGRLRSSVPRFVGREKYDSMVQFCKEVTDERESLRQRIAELEAENVHLQADNDQLRSTVKGLRSQLRKKGRRVKV